MLCYVQANFNNVLVSGCIESVYPLLSIRHSSGEPWNCTSGWLTISPGSNFLFLYSLQECSLCMEKYKTVVICMYTEGVDMCIATTVLVTIKHIHFDNCNTETSELKTDCCVF